MSKKIGIIAIILSAAAIVMSIINLVPVINSPDVQMSCT